MILDIHTHHPAPRPQAVVCVAPDNFSPVAGQSYSVGIHPWSLAVGEPPAEMLARLEETAMHPQVVAIGETGLDLLKGGPLFRQINLFRKHVELSERIGKPLVIHCVRAYDRIVALRREYKPRQKWVLHGFRAKPTILRMVMEAGLWVSVGEHFNSESLPLIPADRLLAETDEASCSIEDIIAAMSGVDSRISPSLIASNTAVFLSGRE